MPLKQEGLDSNPWRAKETEAQVNTCSLKIFLLLSKRKVQSTKASGIIIDFSSSLTLHMIEA
jgi:hypothetical protein